MFGIVFLTFRLILPLHLSVLLHSLWSCLCVCLCVYIFFFNFVYAVFLLCLVCLFFCLFIILFCFVLFFFVFVSVSFPALIMAQSVLRKSIRSKRERLRFLLSNLKKPRPKSQQKGDCHVLTYCIMSWHAASCFVMLWHAVLWHIMSWHVL